MPRTLSLTARRAVHAQETGEVFLALLTIDHPILPEPIWLVNNTESIVSNGKTFLGCPFTITLPPEDDDKVPTVELSVDNVDRQIVLGVRLLPSPALVTLEIILASSPDVREAGPFNFTMRGVTYDAQVVTGTLTYEDVLVMGFPTSEFTPAFFPALFGLIFYILGAIQCAA